MASECDTYPRLVVSELTGRIYLRKSERAQKVLIPEQQFVNALVWYLDRTDLIVDKPEMGYRVKYGVEEILPARTAHSPAQPAEPSQATVTAPPRTGP